MDGLEQELRSKARIMRLNIADSAGREAAARYLVDLMPAILVFDKDGRERYRTVGQLPRRSRIIQAVEASLAGGEKSV